MCHYITLIAPTEDQAALHAVMEKHGRRAILVENDSVAKLLLPDERQYLTYRAHCDCGTVLGWRKHEREVHDHDRFAHEEAKMRRKGWSEAKIQRALEGRLRAQTKPSKGPLDSYEFWQTIVSDIFDELKLPSLGLLVHFYSGRLDEESIRAVRNEVPRGSSVLSVLEDLPEDVVTIFTRPEKRLNDALRGQVCPEQTSSAVKTCS